MNFAKLKYFLLTAEELNISRAAEKLFISQQALSSQISQMEQYYGVRLFNRKPTFSLTYEGLCLQQKAREILQLEQDFMNEIELSPNHYSGILKIGYSRDSGSCLTHIIPSYHQKHPLVRFELHQGSSQQLYDWLSQGRIDFIMDYHAFSSIDLLTVSLVSERLFILFHESQYRKGESVNLTDSPLLLLSRDHYTRKILDRYLRSSNIIPHIQAESNDMDMLISMCRKGMGITFCPESLTHHLQEQNHLEPLAVIPLEAPETLCNYILGYMSGYTLLPAAASFIDTVKEYFHSDVPHSGII